MPESRPHIAPVCDFCYDEGAVVAGHSCPFCSDQEPSDLTCGIDNAMKQATRGGVMKTINLPRDEEGNLSVYAWPGGYPVFYITQDAGTLCPGCATDAEEEGITTDPSDPQWYIVAGEINWEDTALYCDHCGERIESAYADPETDDVHDPSRVEGSHFVNDHRSERHAPGCTHADVIGQPCPECGYTDPLDASADEEREPCPFCHDPKCNDDCGLDPA